MQWGPDADAKVYPHTVLTTLYLGSGPFCRPFLGYELACAIWCADYLLQLFMHVLRIHNVKLDFNALALAMGNGKFPTLLFTGAIPSQMEPVALSTLYQFIFCRGWLPCFA